MASLLEMSMLAQIQDAQLPEPEREYRFCERRWRFDFAWPALMLAVEVEGGTRNGGRHNRHEGFEKDCEKYNAAAMLGWKVLRFTSTMVGDGSALEAIQKAVAVSER